MIGFCFYSSQVFAGVRAECVEKAEHCVDPVFTPISPTFQEIPSFGMRRDVNAARARKDPASKARTGP